MRIAMLIRRFNPAGGGTERDFAAAADCLSQAGHDVRIYAARCTATTPWHGMAVRRLPFAGLTRSLEAIGFGLLAARFARRDGSGLTLSFGRSVDSDLIRCEGGAHAAYLAAARQWESRAASAARAMSPYHIAQCRIEAAGFRSPKLRMVLAFSPTQDFAGYFAAGRLRFGAPFWYPALQNPHTVQRCRSPALQAGPGCAAARGGPPPSWDRSVEPAGAVRGQRLCTQGRGATDPGLADVARQSASGRGRRGSRGGVLSADGAPAARR